MSMGAVSTRGELRNRGAGGRYKEQKTSYLVRRCPTFRPKSSEEQKKVFTSADVRFFALKQVKSKKRSPHPQFDQKLPKIFVYNQAARN